MGKDLSKKNSAGKYQGGKGPWGKRPGEKRPGQERLARRGWEDRGGNTGHSGIIYRVCWTKVQEYEVSEVCLVWNTEGELRFLCNNTGSKICMIFHQDIDIASPV